MNDIAHFNLDVFLIVFNFIIFLIMLARFLDPIIHDDAHDIWFRDTDDLGFKTYLNSHECRRRN